MKIYFYTQDYENYGTPGDPYWKPKGGSDFILDAPEWLEGMITDVYDIINYSGDMFIRDVVGHLVVNDQFKTDCEMLQLEYEGKIEYPSVRMSYDEFIKLSERVKESI